MENTLWKHIETVKKTVPLIHNITNYVVMNNTANALLAAGASPIMANAHSEMEDMVSICQGLVINIGTLTEYSVESMLIAAKCANKTNTPWVLDPVGAGATTFRNETLSKLIALKPTIIRANASEILALATTNNLFTKGVDSTAESNEAILAAKELNKKYGAVISISGATDIIIDGDQQIHLSNGNKLMTKVTGLGCSTSAITAAFAAVIPNKFEATCTAMALFGVCGELAAKKSDGPGTLQLHILDELFSISERAFQTTLKLTIK
ncbi:hydroxyethylthiazole kinase [Zunongwangia sp.]|uniref:hydroxyethylthiazole kinase n=1 Tax=Zunongwangia sp. TaxID=1965325 RepID=UPI003AA873FA